MPALIEKIYYSKADIEEYQKAAAEGSKPLKDWQELEDLLESILRTSEAEKKRLRKLEAFKKAFGLLADLTPEEWQIFNEAARRRPLFGKDRDNED
jgi:FixJ family two-component response regulator